MRIELNIGLDSQERPNTHSHIELRVNTVRHMLARFTLFSRRYTTSYPGPEDVQINERGLFCALEANSLFAPAREIYRLAEAIDQDCIAVYYPSRGSGLLIGPGADKWGVFDPQYFRRFDRADERLAA